MPLLLSSPVRRSSLVALSFGAYLVAPPATAAQYVQPAAPEAPEPTAWRATPLVPPQSALDDLKARVPATAAGHAQANTFFLNYGGVTLKKGNQDNSATDTSIFWSGTFQPYGDGAKRTASLQAVQADWAKYDVIVTDVRPQGKLYTMCVNSPTNIYGGGVLGVAPLDCMDNMAANIVLAFHSANDQFSAATQATTMSQEIAHAYGLEHVNQPNDIMNPYNAGGDPSFLDQCLTLDGGGNPIQCGSQHNQFCNNGQQNSHQEMMWLFGPSEPDLEPPMVSITYPTAGQQFDEPAAITITAQASDDVGVAQVDLYIDGANQNQPRFSAPYGWEANFPAGTYCLAAEARDNEPNITKSAEVCFTVVKGGEPPDPTGGTSGGTTSGGDPPDLTTSGGDPPDLTTSGGGTSGADEGGDTTGGPGPGSDSASGGGGTWSPDSSALPPGFGGDDGDEGCGCAQPERPGAAGLLLLLAFGLVRRRR